MTVFKGFLTITKRNLGYVFMYIIIFLTITIAVQKSELTDTDKMFEQTKLDIAVIDHDKSPVSEALTDYLASRHNLIDIPDTKTAIQDNLFYRHVYYVLTIPKDFTQSCKSKTASLTVTKVPGSTSGYYVDSQVNAWVQEMHMLLASGYSAEDATVMLKEAMTEESHVTMLDQNGYGGNIPMHAYMYQYMPYIILSILCYVIITIMMSFNNPEVRSRILCTSISSRKYNLQLRARLHSHRTCRLVFMHTPSNHIVWKNISGRYKSYILSDQQLYDGSVRTKPGILCLHIYRQRTTDQCSRQCGQPWNVLPVRSLRQYGYPRKKCTENCPVSSGLLVRSCK